VGPAIRPLKEVDAMFGQFRRFGARPVGSVGVLMLTLFVAGCSRGTGNVSGKVLFKGQPLPAGTITFYDDENGVTSSAINPDGTYAVSKVRTGAAKVAVAVPLPINMPGVGPALVLPQTKVPSIPPHYHDRERSGLTLDVVKGDQVHNFELQP
jgi:hypothetical protein